MKNVCGIAKPASELSLSSSESVETTKPAQEFSKAINSRLQSPIESHFANTPTTESKTSSPANGITNSECGELLCQELDNLVLDDQLKLTHRSKESIACSDDLIPIHSLSTSTEELGLKDSKRHSKETINSAVSFENLKSDEDLKLSKRDALNDLLSPAEESISMFTQLNDKLNEMSSATEGDSGVDMAQNVSDDETCRPEVSMLYEFSHFGHAKESPFESRLILLLIDITSHHIGFYTFTRVLESSYSL